MIAPNHTRNKTLTITDDERNTLRNKLLTPTDNLLEIQQILDKTICCDLFEILDKLPASFVDLLIIDPPYNLNKSFNGNKFSKMDDDEYLQYLESWFPKLLDVMKPIGSIYLCGDWTSTYAIYQVMCKYTKIRNRIIWQREKGRGAKANWKNACEDIWFGTMSNDYYFNVEAVKMKRQVIAPYRINGEPKDWEETDNGKFRLTYPSNFWDDISIPYWSMPENTAHPTQKPEKLIAKLILASCPADGVVLDPFLGSGTTSVVAKKLGRRYIGIEMDEEYCCWAEKRLRQADNSNIIQGFSDGVFWERNTANLQMKNKNK
ncbi:MAG: site-specific DNA-methyltransferase [Ignavibacteria bacterium]|jgi:site-specific DNA-methyltransferase (adenine-specific)|nr:site-specific DNA-methyltransferase [Ignavibacteria bacterium]